MLSSKSDIKFQMIQNYRQKCKILKHNLIQSQSLNHKLKDEILKMGQQSNSLFISISAKTNRINDLKSINPRTEKQLNYTKEELKRIEYKTQKNQIKLKQYEDRLKRFEDMYKVKCEKNRTFLDKIHQLETKLKEQKTKKIQLANQLGELQPKKQPSMMSSLKVQSQYLKSISKKSNPLDEMQIQLLGTSTKIKKLTQEQQQLVRKNSQLKSNINKLQQQIHSIQQFMSSSSCIPEFVQDTLISQRESSLSEQNVSEERILKYSDRFNLDSGPERYKSKGLMQNSKLEDRIKKASNQLPNRITSSLSNFDNFKSKTILDSLVTKHSQITEQQDHLMSNLKQNVLLMSELTKVNSILETQIVQENSKLSAFNIMNKKWSQMYFKALS